MQPSGIKDSHRAVHYIPGTCLFYTGSLYPVTPFTHLPPPQPLATDTLWSVSVSLFFLFLLSKIPRVNELIPPLSFLGLTSFTQHTVLGSRRGVLGPRQSLTEGGFLWIYGYSPERSPWVTRQLHCFIF